MTDKNRGPWDIPLTEEQKKQLEPELFEELNELPEEEEFEYQEEVGGRSPFIKIAGLITVLAFITIFLGNSLQALTWPSLDFIHQSQELSQDPEIQEWKEAVGLIQLANRRGTGFYIEPEGYFVTNEHVVRDAGQVTARFVSGSMHGGKKVASFPEVDLALIELNSREVPWVQLELEEKAYQGQQVIIIGNPMGFPQIVKEGIVLGKHNLNNWEEPVLAIKAPIHQGSSGSPVFNDKGKVIGVIFATLRNPGDEENIIGLAVPVNQLIDRIEQYKERSLPQ
ncbi:S1-C subfamily serine protease [Desulfitispora alkaliphila]|uniref:S1C family serine protease n=1 Tax=Desulfitispora alkaliphila TaxID=622674 RepID=UPI003D1DC8C2